MKPYPTLVPGPSRRCAHTMAKQHLAADVQIAGEVKSSYAVLFEKLRRLTFVSEGRTAMLMREDPRDILAAVYELLRSELHRYCCFNYLVEDDATRLRLNF